MTETAPAQGAPTPTGTAHLIERAAERLRREGVAAASLEGATTAPRRPVAEAAPSPLFEPAPRTATPVPPPPEAVPTPNGDGRIGPIPSRPAIPRPPVIDMAQLMAAGMIDWTGARTRVSEEFRVIQAQALRHAFPIEPEPAAKLNGHGAAPAIDDRVARNTVMLTSARPGEGKSFTALNLAAGIARQRDRDVLLIDLDAKPDSLGRRLGAADRPGLLDLAADPRIDPQSLLSPTEFSHLTVLGFGTSPIGSEIIASRQMARVIRDLGRRYADRIVILDAPPCLASSDASAVAPIVGQIIFVVEAETTQRPEVEAALDMIQSCPNITLMLNKVQIRTRHTFGGYPSLYTAS